MEIQFIDRADNISQVILAGRLDVDGVQKIDTRFAGYTAAQRRSAIIDLSQVDFVASIGMGMLLSNAAVLQREKAQMVLLNPQLMVEKVLRTANVDKHLPIVRTEEEALAILQP